MLLAGLKELGWNNSLHNGGAQPLAGASEASGARVGCSDWLGRTSSVLL